MRKITFIQHLRIVIIIQIVSDTTQEKQGETNQVIRTCNNQRGNHNIEQLGKLKV